jgi:hypothetical protein
MDFGKPRRSAGMRGTPRNEPFQEHAPPPAHLIVSSQPGPEAPRTSRFARPQVLMDAVSAPLGQMAAAERAALRAFMRQHRLTATGWAAKAGVPANQLLAFLTGKSRTLPPGALEKLAAAAGASPAALFAVTK